MPELIEAGSIELDNQIPAGSIQLDRRVTNDLDQKFSDTRELAGEDAEKRARNAATIEATYDVPMDTAFDMQDAIINKTGESSLWDKATGSFKAGWGDVYSSVGGMMKRKGIAPEFAENYIDFGERLKRAYIPPSDKSEFTWRKMKDPEWYATTIMRSVPFSLSLIPASVLGAYVGVGGGTALGLGLFGRTILGSIGGAVMARPAESAFEAQGAYEEAKGLGFTEDDAEVAADKVFWDNMKLVGLDAAELAAAFIPMGKIAGSSVKSMMAKRVAAVTGKVGAVAGMTALEERYQEKSISDAVGDYTDFFDFNNPRLNEASAAGAVFGLGLSGTGSVFNVLKGRVVKTMPDGTKQFYDNAKNAALANGIDENTATIMALDAVAGTEEGKAHIENVVIELKNTAEGNGKPIILGVDETVVDGENVITSFTMADPITGDVFTVPASQKIEGDTISYMPDQTAINDRLEKTASDDLDAQIDRLIEGDDTAIEQVFGKEADVPNFDAENDLAPQEIVEPTAKVEPLIEEAKKYKSAEEFVRAQGTRTGVEVRDKIGTKLQDPYTAEYLPTNSDGTITLYHSTTKEGAEKIKQSGIFGSKTEGGDIYFTTNKKGYGGIGKDKDVVLAFNVDPKKIKFDDVYRGELHLKGNNTDIGGIKPVVIKTKSQLTEIWNKAQEGNILDTVKAINDTLGEKGSIDLEPIVNLGRSIIAEGHKTYEAFTARAKEVLGEAWEKVKELVEQAWNKLKEERGSISTKEKATDMVTREELNKAVADARKAFKDGNAAELKKLKNSIKWMAQRKNTLKNVRDYFGLTDNDMSKISKKNPLLMDEQEFAQYLKDVNLKAIDFKENQFARAQLIRLIEEKRLQKVDNYRRSLELPSISEMTTEQLRQFAQLLEPFQYDDVFLTQRELETVDRTKLAGIRTWREAKENLLKEINAMREKKGMEPVKMEDLSAVKVAWNESFKWDASLRDQDPFFDLLVTKMTESTIGAELKIHNIESEVYDLAKKANKSRKRGIVERMIPKDTLIFEYLEAPNSEKNAIAQQMTPEQLRLAHYMNEYFANYLNYLISIKSIDKGRQNYITHIRKTFLENVRDKGLKEGVTSLFTAYQEDMMGFNILDDATGDILPLEKFFQYSLHRTGELDPSQNIVRVFMTYVKTAERKRMFDATIPYLDIYTQSLTPMRYTPRGLEMDRSLKTFVNKWINNKKGRKISYDSVLRQGGPVDVGIRALRTFLTVKDLGCSIPAGMASVLGEQVTNRQILGDKGMALGSARMATAQGKRIIKKYEAFTERSLWESLTAPGDQINQRLMTAMFGMFHASTRIANKQLLLGMMTEQEYNSETISTERLAEITLEKGRYRVVSGSNSLIGSTSIGNAYMQYKTWAIPFLRTLLKDMGQYAKDLNSARQGKMGVKEALTTKEAIEIYRFIEMTAFVTITMMMLGVDEEDDSFIGKLKYKAFREANTLIQGFNPALWLGASRMAGWLGNMGKAIEEIILLEEYKTKEGLKGVDRLKRETIELNAVRQFKNKDDEE